MRCRSLAEMPVRRVEILEHGAKPHLERLARLLEHRSRGQARLVVAFGALEGGAVADRPHALAAAARAGGLAAPARLDPVGAAVILGRKALLELGRRLRKITPQIVSCAGHGSIPCSSS